MNLSRLAERRNAALATALLGVLLLLPMLGKHGLWEPYEIRIADIAKEVASSGGWAMPARSPRPPLVVWLITAGFRTFGVGEWGGRLPIALSGIVALFACLYAGTALVRRRGALLGVIALASTPLFFLGARSLVTDVPMFAAQALAIGGLARAFWPARDSSIGLTIGHALIGAFGLLLGQLDGGTLIGVTLPLAAMALALVVTGRGEPFAIARLCFAIIVSGALLTFEATRKPGVYTALLGGIPRGPQHAIEFTTVIRRLGFAAFPWIALLPLALARPFATVDSTITDEEEVGRARFGRLALLSWVGVGYVLTTLQSAWIGELAFPAIAGIALLAGDFLDGALDDDGSRGPLAMFGFLALIGVVVLAHDVFLTPEHYLGAHVLDGIKWPGPLEAAPFVILAAGCVFALCIGFGLGLGRARSVLLQLGVGVGLLIAIGGVYWMVPALSAHLSFKGLFTEFKALGGADGELAQYHAPASTSWGGLQPKDLSSLDQVFAFLAKPTRAFVIVSADDMAPVDQYARSHEGSGVGVSTYYVVDDSNSRFVLLSNKLSPGKKDLNPLRRLVVDKLPRAPQHEVHADFEGKIELVGYDLPAELDRGPKFTITLYYKVLAPIAAAEKVFVHFDGSGTRFNGDHIPLDGKFPTNYWVPGYYIIDEHKMDVDHTMTPAGFYQIYTGFWAGADRLKVVTGASDGENRVKIGSVRVK